MNLQGRKIRIQGKGTLVLKQPIGSGAFSQVYATNDPALVCKAINIDTALGLDLFLKEADYLRRGRHQNVVRLFYSLQLEGTGVLFLQRCKTSLLQQMLGGRVQQRRLLRAAIECATVLCSLHAQGITHRDIKLQNMLLDEQGHVKLCDFGSCTDRHFQPCKQNLDQLEDQFESVTTPMYRAPQILDLHQEMPIGQKVDVFAFGVALFIAMFQKPPFEGKLAAVNGQAFFPYENQLTKVIRGCFTVNPVNRPSASEVLNSLLSIELNYDRVVYLRTRRQLQVQMQQFKVHQRVVLAVEQQTFSINSFWSKLTTQTEGWVRSYLSTRGVEGDQDFSLLRDKFWEKPYKQAKIIQVLATVFDESKSLSTLLLLALFLYRMHREGPPDLSSRAVLDLVQKIEKHARRPKVQAQTLQNQMVLRCCTMLKMRVALVQRFREYLSRKFSTAPLIKFVPSKPEIGVDMLVQLIKFYPFQKLLRPKCQIYGRDVLLIRVVKESLRDHLLSLTANLLCAYCLVAQRKPNTLVKLGKLSQALFVYVQDFNSHMSQISNCNNLQIIAAFASIKPIPGSVVKHILNAIDGKKRNHFAHFSQLIMPSSQAAGVPIPPIHPKQSWSKPAAIKNCAVQQLFVDQNQQKPKSKQQRTDWFGEQKYASGKLEGSPKQDWFSEAFQAEDKQQKKSTFIEEFDFFGQRQQAKESRAKFKNIDIWSKDPQKQKQSVVKPQLLSTELFQVFFVPRQKEEQAGPFEVGVQAFQTKEAKLLEQKYETSNLQQFLKKEMIQNIKEMIIPASQIQTLGKLGEGSSCCVYEGRWRALPVAIKKLKQDFLRSSAISQFKRQVSTLIRIRPHKNILNFIGLVENESDKWLIVQICRGGTLFELLHLKKSVALTWEQRIRICKALAEGLQFLHTYNILHRDLKSLNVLLESKQTLQIKIADFGLARQLSKEFMTGRLGTLHWMAPEVIRSGNYDLSADIYSLGIIFWEVASRKTPYYDIQNISMLPRLVCQNGLRPRPEEVDQGCPPQLVALMQACWSEGERPPLGTVVDVLGKLLMQK